MLTKNWEPIMATTTINLRILWLCLTILLSNGVRGIILKAPTLVPDTSYTSGENCSAILKNLVPLSLAPTSINYTGKFPRKWIKRASQVSSTSISPKPKDVLSEVPYLSSTSDIQSESKSTTPSDFRESLTESVTESSYVLLRKPASRPVTLPIKSVEVKGVSEVSTTPTVSSKPQFQLATASNLTSISGFLNGLQTTTQSNIVPSLITLHKEPKAVLPTVTKIIPSPTLTQKTLQLKATTKPTVFTTSSWYSVFTSVFTNTIATISFKLTLNETYIPPTPTSSDDENSIYTERQMTREINSLIDPIHEKQYRPSAQKYRLSEVSNNSKVESLHLNPSIASDTENLVTPLLTTNQNTLSTLHPPVISSPTEVTPRILKGKTFSNTTKLTKNRSYPTNDLISLEKELDLVLASRLPLALDEDLLDLWRAPYLQRLRYVNHEMVDEILQTETESPPKSSDCPLEYQELMFLTLQRILGLLIISLPQSLKEVEEAMWDNELDAYFFRPQEKNIIDVHVCRECFIEDHNGNCRPIFSCRDGATPQPTPRLTPTMLRRLAAMRG